MKWLVMGDGPEERAWCAWLVGQAEYAVIGACPGFDQEPDVPRAADLDALLATSGADAVVVGGSGEVRGEALRRVAAEGMPAICLHPPGENADPYYQVALTPQETGAVVIPDMPLRLHPGVARLREAIERGEVGALQAVRLEWEGFGAGDLMAGFAQTVDIVRALIGEVESLTATGVPEGPLPEESLSVHLRSASGKTGEVRLSAGRGATEPPRLRATGADGVAVWELGGDEEAASRVWVARGSERTETAVGPWDARGAIVGVLEAARRGEDVHPDLLDATRSTELMEAVARSLKRGRTIDVHYEEISEASSFKAVMTSAGCGLIVLVLALFVLSRVGLALDIEASKYLAWLTIPLMVVFAAMQLLRYAGAHWNTKRSEVGAT